MNELLQRFCRRVALGNCVPSFWRATLLRLRGAMIGPGTRIPPRTQATWPHQIRLGSGCVLQSDIFFNYDHYWTPGPSIIIGDRIFIGRGCEFNIRGRLEIGDDSLIAAGCTFIDHDHGRHPLRPMNSQEVIVRPIVVGRNVWIGAQSIILKGVSIGDGAVIAAGAIVTKSVGPGETWAGVPATPVKSACQRASIS